MTAYKILIVEDDPFIAMDLENAVLDQFGDAADLVVVRSIDQARRAVSAPVSCALLDIDVVGGKTFPIADTLQRNGIPFAFVSGSIPADVPPHLRSARFVRKPFSTQEVSSFVRQAVTQGGTNAGAS